MRLDLICEIGNSKAKARSIRGSALTVLAALLVISMSAHAQEEPAPLQWQQGPMTAPIGRDLAEVEITDRYIYLDSAETQRFLEMNQNPVGGEELATLASISDDESWFMIFEFSEAGYVPDDEKDELDAEALLESIREGNAAGNVERQKRGWSTMEIVGWNEEPHYDDNTNNLSWAIIVESEGVQSINRMVKVLGRRGVMTVTLVSSSEELDYAVAEAGGIMNDYRFRPGSTYAEYLPGTDKLADYGLAALVVGGAGAALFKSGLLVRMWKPIALGLAALVAGIKRFFHGDGAKHDPNKPIG